MISLTIRRLHCIAIMTGDEATDHAPVALIYFVNVVLPFIIVSIIVRRLSQRQRSMIKYVDQVRQLTGEC